MKIRHADKNAAPTQEQIGLYNIDRAMDNVTVADYQTGPRRGQQLAQNHVKDGVESRLRARRAAPVTAMGCMP
jgi:hypothetical protein